MAWSGGIATPKMTLRLLSISAGNPVKYITSSLEILILCVKITHQLVVTVYICIYLVLALILQSSKLWLQNVSVLLASSVLNASSTIDHWGS